MDFISNQIQLQPRKRRHYGFHDGNETHRISFKAKQREPMLHKQKIEECGQSSTLSIYFMT